ncbi:hypothetical protein ARALYDRAFT_902940 [Arabidopsis lyrata subsp. lyrata]|uniref:Avr9/Cf-9 rapidly elicited protein 146 n=1 Tax=Arabidopsis lyrata subsp. lyrata TaxID=81972 RepID=D7LKE4_ARALL|nr:hypothetical protein ARALYDRAFT_902940 [Arabidopsis lyrata subsp. lyrata]
MEKNVSIGKKLLADFKATLKRGKNLMFHNRRRVPVTASAVASHPQKEYEFSCSDTPNYTFPSNMAASKKKSHHNSLFSYGHAPPTLDDDTSVSRAVLELLNSGGNHDQGNNTPPLSVEALTALSTYLPGFGRSNPSVRPLRVTDSPFPLREDCDVANGYVDKAADEFVKKFYKNLNQQKKMIESSTN